MGYILEWTGMARGIRLSKVNHTLQCRSNGRFWLKVKVLSFKVLLCNEDNDIHITLATAHVKRYYKFQDDSIGQK